VGRNNAEEESGKGQDEAWGLMVNALLNKVKAEGK